MIGTSTGVRMMIAACLEEAADDEEEAHDQEADDDRILRDRGDALDHRERQPARVTR
jgi:hypothetical protein